MAPSQPQQKMTFFVLFLKSFLEMKLPALRARLRGNELSFLIVPLDPAYPAMAGHIAGLLDPFDR